MIENSKPAECEDLDIYRDVSGFEETWNHILRCVKNLKSFLVLDFLPTFAPQFQLCRPVHLAVAMCMMMIGILSHMQEQHKWL